MMKNFKIQITLIVTIIFVGITSKAQLLKSENTPDIQLTPNTQDASYNDLRDETGKKIFDQNSKNIIPDDPGGDAMQKTIFEGHNTGERFGNVARGAGDVNGDGYDDIIVGAFQFNSNTGRAYIYYGGPIMNTTADIILTGEATSNFFGISCSTAGDVNNDGYSDVIVGANTYNSNTGRSYIFFGGSAMDTIADIIMTGEAAGNFFGAESSTAGDVNNDGYSDVIIGASGYNSNTGRSYIFFGGASMDNIPDVIMTGSAGDRFGLSDKGAGDVNADGYSDVIIGSISSNRIWIFYGGASMNNIADVIITGEVSFSNFGTAVSTAGDVNGDGYSDVIVGANHTATAKAYIFYGGAPMDTIADVIMASGTTSTSTFGTSSTTAGDVNSDGYSDVIIGDYFTNRACIFFGGASMNNTPDVIMTGDTVNSQFGISCSAAGDVNGDGNPDVIAGARNYNSNTGRVYLFDYFMKGDIVPDIAITGEATGIYFGSSVSTAGDINNDGYDDVIVGAEGHNTNQGRAYIFFGGAVLDNTADLRMTGEAVNNYFGRSVSAAGDVNNDGYDDVIVGARGNTSNTGRAYIYYGSASPDTIADVILNGAGTLNSFGASVSAAGDVNNDGYSDVIVGAFAVTSFTGKTYVFFGGSSMDNTADVTMTGETTNNSFGTSVASAGDFNHDNFDDVIVGASGYNSNTGRSYIFYGGVSMDNTADVIFTGETTSNYFGASCAGTGDVNADGYDDVIAGAYGYNSNNGRAYIYYGGASPDNIADVTMTGTLASGFFGVSCGGAGDVNGDGYADALVGAMNAVTAFGKAYVFSGGNIMDNISDVTMTGEAVVNFFGNSVAGAGDVNGDGFPDIIVSALRYSSNTGRAYIYLSSAINTKPVLNLTMFIEGFYNSLTNSQVSDTITVYLRSNVSPHNKIDSAKSVVSSIGKAVLKFNHAANGNYYIALTHRNSIETWSANTVSIIGGSTSSYDFSNSSAKAFGNNLKQVDGSPVRFAIYSGDVNRDGVVDAIDAGPADNDAFNFITGYVKTDVNGNNVVDVNDLAIIDNNAFNYVSKITPP